MKAEKRSRSPVRYSARSPCRFSADKVNSIHFETQNNLRTEVWMASRLRAAVSPRLVVTVFIWPAATTGIINASISTRCYIQPRIIDTLEMYTKLIGYVERSLYRSTWTCYIPLFKDKTSNFHKHINQIMMNLSNMRIYFKSVIIL